MAIRFKSLSEARKHLGNVSFKENGSLGKTDSPTKPSTKRTPTKKSDPTDSLSPPHRLLWSAVVQKYGAGEVALEFENSVPGRRFRLDIAFPYQRLAIEVDGWQYHGKFKKGFLADREKQNLLVQNQWRVLRFTAGQIFNDIDRVMSTINAALMTKA